MSHSPISCSLGIEIEQIEQDLGLQQRLEKTETELTSTRSEVDDLVRQLGEYKAELRREQELNEVALKYIPESLLGDYHEQLPRRQPDWTFESVGLIMLMVTSCGMLTST